MGKRTQGVYGSWELSSLLPGEAALWWKTVLTKIPSMYPRDWAQGEFRYELFPPFLHHYKSCFHPGPRQMDLGSEGQTAPSEQELCKGHGCASFTAQGKPSPAELGNHPRSPDSVQPLWEGAWANPQDHTLGIPTSPRQEPEAWTQRKKLGILLVPLSREKLTNSHKCPITSSPPAGAAAPPAALGRLCCWPGTSLRHTRARLGTNRRGEKDL